MFVSLEIPGRLWGSMGHKIQDFGTSGVAFDSKLLVFAAVKGKCFGVLCGPCITNSLGGLKQVLF